ncbi:TauD/TfdA family dioxygenase [Streptomyces alfalfae]|uniref:TauD/TfdA family dioxygenase n=1 Tax=Streptomyces alfalfae TaxID=1642299 RepID=A0A1P8TQB3_9ACTN|nr:TauD/TfdA family dioxygenase [Streptomyces alfalfae]AYA20292.1 TauD/TfdA family dioxygenase [Streptomyces fradiae]APY89839.1 taurine dioxygenase [Streptomyces alfalfae]QQC87672.1 TauD/TfdA family dioxygenase [Streptomyces alfalfae]QUI30103.1 TauD/TfdA family dioxygenase [Streptomyces alfalfae]RXX42657.1 TauD/TfdA family dioxygenase [Streptomyces alfalfae]
MSTTSTGFDIRRIGGRIGAEIHGVDLSADLDPAIVTEINSALLEHKALVFRDQGLDDAGQLRFASLFGALTNAHPTVPSVDGQPEILPVDGDEGIRANHWHTDVTFVRTPPKASTLRSIVVPPYGGNTLIANSAAAYRDLPDALRDLADRLWAVHTNDYDYAAPRTEKAAEHRRRFVSRKYRTAHPVVRVHPETGERGLFIGGFAQSIIGLSPSESRDLLRIFQAYVTRPENIVRVVWSPGDLVLFDNRITQHYAPDDYGDLPRLLHRVTVAGDAPAGVDGALSRVVEGDEAAHYTPSAA